MPDDPCHPCPYCRRSFQTVEARYQHAQAKHQGLPLRSIVPDSVRAMSRHRAARRRQEDHEPSMASIAVEAQQKWAMGEPLDPLEESLLP